LLSRGRGRCCSGLPDFALSIKNEQNCIAMNGTKGWRGTYLGGW
jgi:hypothetical protein